MPRYTDKLEVMNFNKSFGCKIPRDCENCYANDICDTEGNPYFEYGYLKEDGKDAKQD